MEPHGSGLAYAHNRLSLLLSKRLRPSYFCLKDIMYIIEICLYQMVFRPSVINKNLQKTRYLTGVDISMNMFHNNIAVSMGENYLACNLLTTMWNWSIVQFSTATMLNKW